MIQTEWSDIREELVRRAMRTRAGLMNGLDDWSLLRPEIQYNYILNEARAYFLEEKPTGKEQ